MGDCEFYKDGECSCGERLWHTCKKCGCEHNYETDECRGCGSTDLEWRKAGKKVDI